jgi:hypothetical protein
MLVDEPSVEHSLALRRESEIRIKHLGRLRGPAYANDRAWVSLAGPVVPRSTNRELHRTVGYIT